MRAKQIIFLLLVLLVSSMTMANEVVMVTEIKGNCHATFESNNWELELAEMVEAGSKITVGQDAFLKLLHIPENKVYTLPASKTVTVTLDTVKGSEKGKSMQLAAVDLNLNADATQQAGTKYIARSPAFRASTQNPPSGKQENTIQSNQFDICSAKEVEIKIKIEDSSTPSNKAKSVSVSPSPSKIKKVKVSNLEAKKKQSKKNQPRNTKIYFALPYKLCQSIVKNQKVGSISLPKPASKIQLTPGVSGDEWQLFSIILDKSVKNNSVEFEISSSDTSFRINLSQQLTTSVISAWRFEKNKQWHQAAAIWLKLLSDNNITRNKKFIKRRLKALELKIYKQAK